MKTYDWTCGKTRMDVANRTAKINEHTLHVTPMLENVGETCQQLVWIWRLYDPAGKLVLQSAHEPGDPDNRFFNLADAVADAECTMDDLEDLEDIGYGDKIEEDERAAQKKEQTDES